MTDSMQDNTKISYDRWMEFLRLIDAKRDDGVVSICVLSPGGSKVRVEIHLHEPFEVVVSP